MAPKIVLVEFCKRRLAARVDHLNRLSGIVIDRGRDGIFGVGGCDGSVGVVAGVSPCSSPVFSL